MTDKTETVADVLADERKLASSHEYHCTEYTPSEVRRILDRIERALAQQPVAWQNRYMMPDVGRWSGWVFFARREDFDANSAALEARGFCVEYRALYATPLPAKAGNGECETCGLRAPPQNAEYIDAINTLSNFNSGADEFTRALEVLRNVATPQPAPQPVEYDRELIAEMLHDAPIIGDKYSREAIAEQVRLLREADNADAAGVRTVRREPGGTDLVLQILIAAGFVDPQKVAEAREIAQRTAGCESQPAVEVTDAMEDRFIRAVLEDAGEKYEGLGWVDAEDRRVLRIGLTAALQPEKRHD